MKVTSPESRSQVPSSSITSRAEYKSSVTYDWDFIFKIPDITRNRINNGESGQTETLCQRKVSPLQNLICDIEIEKLISKDRLNYISRMLSIPYKNVDRSLLYEGFYFFLLSIRCMNTLYDRGFMFIDRDDHTVMISTYAFAHAKV